MHGALSAALAVLFGTGTATTPTAAGDQAVAPQIRVVPTNCPNLDATALQEQLSLELAGNMPSAKQRLDLQLNVRCEADELVLSVNDPQTGRALERSVVAPALDHPEPERVVALSASELFATAWLELLSAPPAQRLPTPPKGQELIEPPETLGPASPPPPRSEVLVGLGLRARALPDLLPLAGVEAGFGHWIRPAWSLFITGSAEYGATARTGGRVDVLMAGAAAGAGWRSRPRKRLRLIILTRASGSYIRLMGRAGRSTIQSGVVNGMGAQMDAAIGASIGSKASSWRVLVEGGYLFAGPTGNVLNGSPVRATGGFVGARLQVAIAVMP